MPVPIVLSAEESGVGDDALDVSAGIRGQQLGGASDHDEEKIGPVEVSQ